MNPREATISPAEAARAAAAATTDDLMLALLPWASSFADPPVSGFRVGAVGLGRSGALYAGANLELRGLPLAATVHAEQALVTNASLHGERGLVALAVTAAPCGHCRQFLNELHGAAGLRVLVAGRAPLTLAELLPAAFGPADLGNAGGLLDAAGHRLAIAGTNEDDLARAALGAANASYAPYTRAYAGVALRTADGSVVTGRYAESAAFNPSLPALQAALVAVALRRLERSAITDAVLVEADGPSSQRTAAEATLAAVAPVPLRYVRAMRTATGAPGAAAT